MPAYPSESASVSTTVYEIDLSAPDVDRAQRAPKLRDPEVLAYVQHDVRLEQPGERQGQPQGVAGELAALRDRAIAANLGLVRMVVRRFSRTSAEHADLMQVGTIGLMAALERFDPHHGTAFASFAVPHIAGQIRHFLRDELPMVQVPRRIRENAAQIRQAREELAFRHGREPSHLELARATELPLSDVIEALHSAHALRPESWDELNDLNMQPDSALELIEVRETLRALLSTLSPRARAVVVLYFWHGMSQAEVAAHLGITQVSVSRIMATSLTRLRRVAA